MYKYLFLILLILTLTKAKTIDSIYISNIILIDENKKDIKTDKNIDKIISLYINKKESLQDIKILVKKLETEYKKRGFYFTKIIIPTQNIKNSLLYLQVFKPKVGKISITGNKYYSKNFIGSRFSPKEGKYLRYNDMLESVLLLNDFNDLKTRVFLKKSKTSNSTDIIIKVKDKKPFHAFLGYDNLGPKSTSKNRASLNVLYGNFLSDGDNLQLYAIKSFSPRNTNLYFPSYTIPITDTKAKLKIEYLYADYIAGGNFTNLGIKGDTNIYSTSVSYALFKNFTDSALLSFKYSHKQIDNHILGTTASKERWNIYILSCIYNHYSIYSNNLIDAKLSSGSLGNGSLKSRENENSYFTKVNFTLSRNQFLNAKTNAVFSLNGQYSNQRVPTVDMFSLGGFGSVGGFEPSFVMGDSGYRVSMELNRKIKKYLDIGLFADYGMAYINHPTVGEYSGSYLFGCGVNAKIRLKKRYTLDIAVAKPVSASEGIFYDHKFALYAVLNIKLW